MSEGEAIIFLAAIILVLGGTTAGMFAIGFPFWSVALVDGVELLAILYHFR